MIAVVVAVGVLAAVLLVVTQGGDSSDDKSPTDSDTRTGRSPAPSLSIPSKLPTELPSRLPSGLPSDFPTDFPSGLPSALPSDLESLFAVPAGDEIPYYMLKKGDCFDVDSSRPGQAARQSCREPHDAEVVRVVELEGTYASDTARSEAASALCEKTLRRETAEQPAGTVRGTLVQYPDTSTYDVGIDNVTCSLVADTGGGSRKLTKPLA
ncbi:septum formation family protein [Streptomyces sp. NPDC086783]|uniref:septum formation family protein n=1 Tax=Streptomyces sp. NPDC086783 TaxID=3365758 RepID=UPI00380CB1BD